MPTYPHRIRLRGPWECEPVAHLVPSSEPLPARCQLLMPCRWRQGLGDFAGRARFRRRFGLPRTLDPFERVWLTFAGVEGQAAVWLNGQLLGQPDRTSEPFAFEITSLLRARNELVVEVEAASGDDGLWGEVALEIRCTAFLRAVLWQTIPEAGKTRLRVTGEVAGIAERPLDVYVLAAGRTVLHASVEAGQRFDLVSDEVDAIAPLRVELVNGGVVWDVIDSSASTRPS